MRPLYVSHAPSTKWVLAASVYRKGGCLLITGHLFTEVDF